MIRPLPGRAYPFIRCNGWISAGTAWFLFLLFAVVTIFAVCRPTLAQTADKATVANNSNRSMKPDRLNYSDKLRYEDKLRYTDRLNPRHVEKLESQDKLKPEHVEKIRAQRDRLNFQRSRERGKAR